ncbi:Gluconate transport-inducing protein [Coemansia sp. RSA 2711]|nr:Gluconate transport-inducing protein [Coemansia sp. RSA 2711]
MEPTYHGYIENADDALLLFEACRVGILQRRKRRLCDRERRNLRSGSVYVWDESESGIRRWTDGKRWSPSRVNSFFLMYTELEPRLSQDDELVEARRSASSDVPMDDGLTKKAFSMFTTDNNKLHVMCYYRKADVESGRLGTPSRDPRLSDITVPRSLYPELMPEMAPRVVPAARARRLSTAPTAILARGCSSLQHVQPPPMPPPQPAGTLHACASQTLQACASQTLQVADAPVYRRSLTTGNYLGVLPGTRVNSAHSAQAMAPLHSEIVASPAPMDHLTPAARGNAALPTNPTSTLAPTAYRLPATLQPATLQPAAGNWAATPSSSRPSTLDDTGGSQDSSGRVQLPSVAELLESIDSQRQSVPALLPSAPDSRHYPRPALLKPGLKTSSMDSASLAALARARYAGTIWNQTPAT